MPLTPLPPGVDPGSAGQIRKHYYLDRYVIVAPKRGLRPDSFNRPDVPHKSPNPKCPFCGIKEPSLYQTPHHGPWQVNVVANAFPALTLSNPLAYGSHEVIIETPRHDIEFSELTNQQRLAVFDAYRHRLNALSALPNIRYVLVWKNDGPLAGESIAHAHSQLMALPLIPPAVELEATAQSRYYAQHGRCAVCDVVTWEDNQGVRVVYSDKHWLVIAPYAASAPFGVWVIPRRHEGQFTHLRPGELESLSTALGLVSGRLDASSISFNWFIHNSLAHEDHHLILKVEPRGTPWAGAEMGTGMAINSVPPEYAALWYRGLAQ